MNKAISNAGRCLLLLGLFIELFRPTLCQGHDWPVHMKISEVAFAWSDGLATFINDNDVPPFLPGNTQDTSGTLTPSEWVQEGSRMEDEQKYNYSEERTMDHFYTVTTNRIPGQVIGLTDGDQHPWWDTLNLLPSGLVNSFVWCTSNGVSGPLDVGSNDFKWSDARNSEFAALTNTASSDRNEFMASMFYSLGHVLHLNQDLTSPDHVRNDNHHYAPHRYIENFGSQNYLNNPNWFVNQSHGWTYWQGKGFTNLLNFWDKGLYEGNASELALALNSDAGVGDQLGLAEWSNGNFLGEDALYNEVIPVSDPFHHFPYPSLSSSVGQTPVIRPSHLKSGKLVNRAYFDKTGDGITFQDHSVVNYLGWAIGQKNGSSPRLSAPTPVWRVSVSLNDTNVLQAYHDILIPKAVEYSTGILDYFFRGCMSVSIGYANSSYIFTNLNISGQDFKDGSFYLFQDDTNQNRILLTNYPFTGVLSNGCSTNFVFSSSELSTNKLLLVYQGTIGINNGGQALDPVDDGIAIAIGEVLPGRIAWWPAEGNADDMIGGHDGVEENVTYTAGQVGQAFAFDPENYTNSPVRIRVPDDPAFILTNSLSIECWVRPRGDGYIIFYRGDNRSGFDPYALSMTGTTNGTFTNVVFQICGQDGTTASVQTPLLTNQWSHVAGTLEGASGSMSLYVNGALRAQTNTTIRPFGELIPDSDPGIGIGNTHEDSSDFPFHGDIDQISLYPRALSAGEVQYIYNAGAAGIDYHLP